MFEVDEESSKTYFKSDKKICSVCNKSLIKNNKERFILIGTTNFENNKFVDCECEFNLCKEHFDFMKGMLENKETKLIFENE